MNLNEKMRERLEKWRKKIPTPPIVKMKPQKVVMRGGKHDYGDVASMEQWEEEERKSQTRR